MSQWDLQANETSVYFKNTVNDEVVKAVQKKFLGGYDTIYVSFDVMGRTRHEQLSYQLGSRLRALYGPKVNIEVGYNYQCVVRWVSEVIKEQPTAYDIDKVIEELNQRRIKLLSYAEDYEKTGDFEQAEIYSQIAIEYITVIEIVKQGCVGKDVE